MTYLLGAVDDLGDPRDQKSNGIDSLRDSYKLSEKREEFSRMIERSNAANRKLGMGPCSGPGFAYDLSEKVVSYLTHHLDNKLATSQEYVEKTFEKAFQNFEANIRARVNVTMPPFEAGESEYATSHRISIGMNQRSVEDGLAKAQASIAAWKDSYKAQDVAQMDWRQVYDFKQSVLAVLKGLDDSERTIIGFGSA